MPKSSAGKASIDASRSADPIARVQRAIERELEKIEAIIGDDDVPGTERTARTLAVLARTLKDVAQINAAKTKSKTKTKLKSDQQDTAEPDEKRMPRDLDEFRRELAQRLDALVAGAAAAGAERD